MLSLTKVFPSPSPSFWELGARSAVWEVKGYPGIWIRRAEDHKGRMYWRMFAAPPYEKLESGRDLSQRVDQALHGQRFQTRRETLEAVGAVLLSLQD